MTKYKLTLLLSFICIICNIASAVGQHYSLSGRITDAKTKIPVEYATITLSNNDLWAISNEKGEFHIEKVSVGKSTLSVSCIGYAQYSKEIEVQGNLSSIKIDLQEVSLGLDEVVVTADLRTKNATTTYTLDRTALDHMQLLDIGNSSALLPGGKTSTYNNLTSFKPLTIRSNGGTEMGNADFGTVIEVDGVRLSTNSVFGDLKGADTRGIGTSNVESIEFIIGVPSVEYGDLSNGVAKINTRKGKSPFIIDMVSKPNFKLIAGSKGFYLGKKHGTLNASYEYAKSVSDIASPYTSYIRNTMTLQYSNIYNKANRQPITISAGLSGNIGGYDSKSDPDFFTDTYKKSQDHSLRANISAKWLLNKSWITNIEATGTLEYSDLLSEAKTNKSNSSSTVAIHGQEEGYFVAANYDENPTAPIVLIPPGYWYQLEYNDSKPIDYSLKLKADWSHMVGTIHNKLLVGANYSQAFNYGQGTYYDDMRYAPTWREYRYDKLPAMNNIALYAEEKMTIPIGYSELILIAGIRSDITIVDASEYGSVSSLSPRFNAKYNLLNKSSGFLKDLSIRAGWGKTVKLPSLSILNPAPTYRDRLSFAPGALDDGTIFYAYHIMPVTPFYNSSLKWEYNNMGELGVEGKLGGVNVSLSFFNNVMKNSYQSTPSYIPTSYKLTDQSALEGSPIPLSNRIYTIDRQTGIVTVSDKTGVQNSQQLAYLERKTFYSRSTTVNEFPVTRRGLEWIVDFGKIPSLKTSFRLDGKYYYYKGVQENTVAYMPAAAQNMADGNPYKYVGYYAGTSAVANGLLTKQLNSNFTVVTHIPAVKLIISLRLESSLYNYSQNLSEYNGQTRGFVLDSKDLYAPSRTQSDIYAGNQYIGVYPLYYTSYEDMNTQIPFAEKFAWAKDNDKALYNELAKLVLKSNTNYYFNPSKISAYFSANIGITKEIGKYVSITFDAKNFLNNMGLVKYSQSGTESSLFDSSLIPSFYYGLSLKIKI